MPHKSHLPIELGHTATETTHSLQQIKDAMAAAIMLQIEATGLPEPTHAHFQVWQSIYLAAHLHTTQYAAAGEATAQ